MPLGPFLCAQSSIFDPSKRLTIHLTGKQVKQTGQLEVWRRCDNVFCRIFVQCVGLNVWFLVTCEALRRMTFITPWRWNGYGGWMCRRSASGSKPWQLDRRTNQDLKKGTKKYKREKRRSWDFLKTHRTLCGAGPARMQVWLRDRNCGIKGSLHCWEELCEGQEEILICTPKISRVLSISTADFVVEQILWSTHSSQIWSVQPLKTSTCLLNLKRWLYLVAQEFPVRVWSWALSASRHRSDAIL